MFVNDRVLPPQSAKKRFVLTHLMIRLVKRVVIARSILQIFRIALFTYLEVFDR